MEPKKSPSSLEIQGSEHAGVPASALERGAVSGVPQAVMPVMHKEDLYEAGNLASLESREVHASITPRRDDMIVPSSPFLLSHIIIIFSSHLCFFALRSC